MAAGRERQLGKRIAACRDRLDSVRARLDGTCDETTLDAVTADLRALVIELEDESVDEAGLGVWLSGLSRKSRYLAVGTAIVVVAVALLVTTLRASGSAARTARYDEIYLKAGAFLGQEKHAEAAQAYREALALLPHENKSADAYNNLGWALQKQGKLDEAIEAYSSALELRPTFELAKNNLAAAQRAKAQGGVSPPSPGPQ